MAVHSWYTEIPYFSSSELKCNGSGILRLDRRFAAALPFLRQQWGQALIPSSVCRAPDYNASEGGHPRSLHLTHNHAHQTGGCMAVDFPWSVWSTDTQLRFSRLAWSLGWSVGLNAWFVHLDMRAALGMRQGVFIYDNWLNQFYPAQVVN